MKFQSKPRVLEAMQYDGDNEEKIYEVFGASGFLLLGDSTSFMLSFKTAHGDTAFARPGDWITPDVRPDTFYPIKDDVMKENYEPVEEGESDVS